MSEKKSFIAHFLKERKMVGAMAPSSKFLAKKMLARIAFDQAKVIVELGPGTGVFTQRIIEQLHPEGKLFVFELNEGFMQALKQKIKDPRVVLIHDSAENIGKHLEKHGVKQADVVVSSLPLANFPLNLKESILRESHRVLKNNSMYVQFQYSLNAKKSIKKFYSNVEITFTPVNFPPAFVYYCTK